MLDNRWEEDLESLKAHLLEAAKDPRWDIRLRDCFALFYEPSIKWYKPKNKDENEDFVDFLELLSRECGGSDSTWYWVTGLMVNTEGYSAEELIGLANRVTKKYRMQFWGGLLRQLHNKQADVLGFDKMSDKEILQFGQNIVAEDLQSRLESKQMTDPNFDEASERRMHNAHSAYVIWEQLAPFTKLNGSVEQLLELGEKFSSHDLWRFILREIKSRGITLASHEDEAITSRIHENQDPDESYEDFLSHRLKFIDW